NWAGNLTYRASRVEHPSSTDELAALLAQGGPVRMLGSRHSFNDLADTDGLLVALDALPAVFEVNRARDAVRVSGGL
ncbi:FAD-binding protein, partial [Bacillus sp. SIMBA_005]|uniref:FAD-binding protein n=1 Tax=Bacillus sp. SIMBA_005 TaxID=3085754 RepID=UPI00397A9234